MAEQVQRRFGVKQRQRRKLGQGSPGPREKIRVGLAVTLAAGALVMASIGLLERHVLASPHPIIHVFFSNTLYMKAWLASAVLVLSFGQLITADSCERHTYGAVTEART